MFIQQRSKRRDEKVLLKVTDGFRTTNAELKDVVGIIKSIGYPYTLKSISPSHYNLAVFCPNAVLEFDLISRDH